MNFQPLNLTHREMYNQYTAQNYQNSEASFSNMFIWRNAINASVATVADMLVLKVVINNKIKYVMPFGNDDCISKCLSELYRYSENSGNKLEIIGANENFVNHIMSSGYKCSFTQDRNAQDYIYLSENLSVLSGKKYHTKKNHVNKFKSDYNYKYVELEAYMLNSLYNKTEKWMRIKYENDSNKYSTELETIKSLFDNFENFGLFGGAIYVNDEPVAYTVGESLREDTALVHIEKADIEYNGAFSIINYEFANHIKNKFKYINREEDMGIEGLRKAKLSYRPEYLIDKIICKFD